MTTNTRVTEMRDDQVILEYPIRRAQIAHLKGGDHVTVETTTSFCFSGRLKEEHFTGALTVDDPYCPSWPLLVRCADGNVGPLVQRLAFPPQPQVEPADQSCEWPAPVVEKVARVLCDLFEDGAEWDRMNPAYLDAYRDDARDILAVVPYVADPFIDVETDRLREIATNPNSLTLSEAASFATRRVLATIEHREQMGTA